MRFFIFISFILTLNLFYSCATNKSGTHTNFNQKRNKRPHITIPRDEKKEIRKELKNEFKCDKIQLKINQLNGTHNEEWYGDKGDLKKIYKQKLHSKLRPRGPQAGPNSKTKNEQNLKELKKEYRELKKSKRNNSIELNNIISYDTITYDSVMVVLENYYVEERLLEYVPVNAIKVETINNGKNTTVIDKTTPIDNSSTGTIAYSVPNEMQVGKSYVIKLRITKEKGKEINRTLILGDRNIPISDIDIDSKITIENIRVARTMTAELISEDETFKVTPQNTDKQVIEDGEYTEWGWMVTPLKSGKTYLKLIIKIKIDTDGEITYKDIVVFDKNIEVKANMKLEVESWISKYWQWLMTTIIIPLIVFLYKNRKNKEEEPKPKRGRKVKQK